MIGALLGQLINPQVNLFGVRSCDGWQTVVRHERLVQMFHKANHLTLSLRMINTLLVYCQISHYHLVHGDLDESKDGLVRQVSHHILDCKLARHRRLLFGLLRWRLGRKRYRQANWWRLLLLL